MKHRIKRIIATVFAPLTEFYRAHDERMQADASAYTSMSDNDFNELHAAAERGHTLGIRHRHA